MKILWMKLHVICAAAYLVCTQRCGKVDAERNIMVDSSDRLERSSGTKETKSVLYWTEIYMCIPCPSADNIICIPAVLRLTPYQCSEIQTVYKVSMHDELCHPPKKIKSNKSHCVGYLLAVRPASIPISKVRSKAKPQTLFRLP